MAVTPEEVQERFATLTQDFKLTKLEYITEVPMVWLHYLHEAEIVKIHLTKEFIKYSINFDDIMGDNITSLGTIQACLLVNLL